MLAWFWIILVVIGIIATWHVYKRYREYKASNNSVTLSQWIGFI